MLNVGVIAMMPLVMIVMLNVGVDCDDVSLPGVLRTVNPHLQASPEGAHFAPPQYTVSSSSLEDLWHRAFENYGLQRPTDVTEIHVFRVILQSSWDKNACTRSVTRTGPMCDPFQTLERIIDEWSDLELEEHDQS